MKDDNRQLRVPPRTQKLMDAIETGFAEYSSNWVDSSRFHEFSGDYAWAVSQLPGQGLTLEIGTGSGRSTRFLLNQGCTVVGLDQNHHCLEGTRTLLDESGFPTEIVYRFNWDPTPEGGVRPNYQSLDQLPPIPLGGCLLVEGDVQQVDVRGMHQGMTDEKIVKLLKPLNFQQVVCWFPGTGWPLPADPAPGQVGINTYKVHMVRNAFEVAVRLLSPGGHLHVVDRTSIGGSAEHSRRLFAAYNMNFKLIRSEERITSLEGYSGVTLHQGSDEKSLDCKLVSLLYQKPEAREKV